MILTQRTQLDTDLAERDASVLRGAEALHHAAAVMRAEHGRFWAIPTDRLIALLNADIAGTLALFQANTQAAQAINAVLDLLDHPAFPGRAPTTTGRADIVLADGVFVHVPAPEPEA